MARRVICASIGACLYAADVAQASKLDPPQLAQPSEHEVEDNEHCDTSFIQTVQHMETGRARTTPAKPVIADGLQQMPSYSFDDFVSKFGRQYVKGSAEWVQREKIFRSNVKDIIAFQENPARSHNRGVTSFADHTHEEYKRVLGYKGRRTRTQMAPSLVQERRARGALPTEYSVPTLESFDLTSVVRDQGGCGSCWAEAATAALESQLQANHTVHKQLQTALKQLTGSHGYTTLSSQQVVSCTLNPHHCGGSGGCDGATAELAYDMIRQHGLPLATSIPYVSGSGSVPACQQNFAGAKLGIGGYVVLPTNKRQPLLEALHDTGGAIAVSAAASEWSFYSDGVFSGSDWTVNHAVVLVGYKMASNGHRGYYKIKNSWGTYWGEGGYIRIQMLEDEDSHCGMDHRAHDGIACDGDPDDTWVCGSSGILYDSVYPTGLHFPGQAAQQSSGPSPAQPHSGACGLDGGLC